ncbi:MAG: PEP-utilizing enzyme [Candidatus Micrarchaeota archaeon]
MDTDHQVLKEVESDLASALAANKVFLNEPIVLARNENSDLLSISKKSSQEFFESLFAADGPLWSLYAKTGVGHPPVNARHLNFIGGRMYFCKNVEKRFISRPGPEKRFSLKHGALCEETVFSPENLLLLLGSPFNMLANSLDISLLPIYINEKAREFSGFKEESVCFCAQPGGLNDAKASMAGALRAMEFSFISSLAAAFKIRIADKSVSSECEAEKLVRLYSDGNEEGAIREFGFHSAFPYDISAPRVSENPGSLRLAAQPAPNDIYARWRENAKFICSRYMCAMRNAYLEVGKQTKLGDLVFHLGTSELGPAMKEPKKFAELASTREQAFDTYAGMNLPSAIVFDSGSWAILESGDREIRGVPAGGQSEATGKAVLIDSEDDYLKGANGKIIVSRTFSPNLTTLYRGAKGVISESGGVLAHSAIIAREMGLPCIVQTKNIGAIREGQTIIVDGQTGRIAVKP